MECESKMEKRNRNGEKVKEWRESKIERKKTKEKERSKGRKRNKKKRNKQYN